MTERKPKGEAWESFVERKIREAQEAGEFDHLPGFGRPLADIDEPYDEMGWLKKKLRREQLSLLPPALQIRLDVEKTLESIWQLTTESEVRRVILALNERIRVANRSVLWGPASSVMPLDVESVVSDWRENRAGSK